MVGEAGLEAVQSGLAPASEGWFAVNVADAAWLVNEAFGARCTFETDPRVARSAPEPAAGRHGAAVGEETASPREAYAGHPHWTLGRPDDWDALPWAAPSS